jgi:hypothetical protein
MKKKHLDLDQNVKTNFKILLLLLLITTIVDLGGAWSTKFSQWKKNLQYMHKTLNPVNPETSMCEFCECRSNNLWRLQK